MKAVDCHAHLDFPNYDPDRQELIDELKCEGIGVITIATDEKSLASVDNLSRENRLVWGAVGLHPTEIGPDALLRTDQILKKLSGLIDGNDKIVAIGEIGLDYHHSQQHIGDQKAMLNELLNFARERNLPVIFHCRSAEGDLLTILRQHPGIKGVVHCYSGTAEQANQYLELGLHLSFTAMLTYPKNDQLRETSCQVPLDRLLLETDAPFLAPQSRRGQRNDPTAVLKIAQLHAQLRSINVEEVLKATTDNAVKLFGLNEG